MSTISASTTTTTAYKVTADTTGTLVLQTGATPTTAITVDTSQNVGIGTSSPAYKLDVLQTQNGSSFVNLANASTGTSARAGFSANSDTVSANFYATGSGYTGVASWQGAGVISVGSGSTNGLILNVQGQPIKFQISTTEYMRLDTSGNLGLGVTPSTWSTGKAMEFVSLGNAVWSPTGNINDIRLMSNLYYNGGYKYAANGRANMLTVGSTAGQIEFYTFANNTSGAGAPAVPIQSMTLDANGNLGIGTSSPFGKLQLAQTNNTTVNGGAYLNLGKGENGVGGYHLIGMGYNAGTDYAPAYMGYVETSNTSGTAGDLVWFTRASGNASTVAPSERARIDSSGNFGIGTTSPGYKLDVNGASGFRGTASLLAGNKLALIRASDSYGWTAYSNASNVLTFDTGVNGTGTTILSITDTGNLLVGTTSLIGANEVAAFQKASGANNVLAVKNSSGTGNVGGILSTFGSNGNNTSSWFFQGSCTGIANYYLYGNGTSSFTSDQRKKKNIEPTRDGYAEDLCKLRVVKYNWLNHEDGTPKELGLIAQEVEQVFPGLVQDDPTPDEDGVIYKTLKASVLPFMLLKAIQEQQALITQLQADVAALKGA